MSGEPPKYSTKTLSSCMANCTEIQYINLSILGYPEERFKYYSYLLYLQVIFLRIILSMHAEEKMIERGISQTEVEKAIKSGSKFIQVPDKIVAEYTYFSVVYKKVGDAYYVITVQPR